MMVVRPYKCKSCGKRAEVNNCKDPAPFCCGVEMTRVFESPMRINVRKGTKAEIFNRGKGEMT